MFKFKVAIFRQFQRRMCYKLNEAKRIAKISRNETELSQQQFNRYEELDNEAQQANKSSMAASYVSRIYNGMLNDVLNRQFENEIAFRRNSANI